MGPNGPDMSRRVVLTGHHLMTYSGVMLLRTLGGLELEGASFQWPKALLLLSYLTLEGPQERHHLGELFWPGSGRGLPSQVTSTLEILTASPKPT